MNQLSRVLLAFALLAASPALAHAACEQSEPRILWSFPAEAAKEVPTNATFWAIASLGSTPRAWLDGVELTPASRTANAASFRPAELAPNRSHLLELDAASEGATSAGRVSVRFTTGAGPATPSTGPITLGEDPDAARASGQAMCREVLAANGCYDAGEDTEMVFDSPERPVLWLTEIRAEGSSEKELTAWPGDCGGPRVITFANAVNERCFELVAIDRVGGERRSGESCPAPAASLCGTPGAPVLPAALLLLIFSLRRRRPGPV